MDMKFYEYISCGSLTLGQKNYGALYIDKKVRQSTKTYRFTICVSNGNDERFAAVTKEISKLSPQEGDRLLHKLKSGTSDYYSWMDLFPLVQECRFECTSPKEQKKICLERQQSHIRNLEGEVQNQKNRAATNIEVLRQRYLHPCKNLFACYDHKKTAPKLSDCLSWSKYMGLRYGDIPREVMYYVGIIDLVAEAQARVDLAKKELEDLQTPKTVSKALKFLPLLL